MTQACLLYRFLARVDEMRMLERGRGATLEASSAAFGSVSLLSRVRIVVLAFSPLLVQYALMPSRPQLLDDCRGATRLSGALAHQSVDDSPCVANVRTGG